MNNNLGSLIRSIRSANNLSQKDFAEKIDASQTAVSYWESGKRQPRVDQIEKIARIFGIELYALPMASQLEEDEQYMLVLFRQLNDSGRNKVQDYARILAQVPEFQNSLDDTNQPLDVK